MKTRKQLNVAFHVADVLMTHRCSQVIANFVKNVDEVHVKNNHLTVTRGKLHECLDITIDFRIEVKCVFSQCDSIKKFWMSLLEDLRGPNDTTLALEDLFKVDVGVEKLDR